VGVYPRYKGIDGMIGGDSAVPYLFGRRRSPGPARVDRATVQLLPTIIAKPICSAWENTCLPQFYE